MTPTDKINVFLHDFDEKNNCLADVTLCDTSVVINDFKVMPGLGGGVIPSCFLFAIAAWYSRVTIWRTSLHCTSV